MSTSAPMPPTPSAASRWGLHLGWLGLGVAVVYGWGAGHGPTGSMDPAAAVVGLTWLMGCWWMTEAVPLAATSMVPLAAFPLLGIMSATEVAPHYFGPFIVLFMGGFMLAAAVERWHLHRRLALRVLLFVGTSPSRLLAGFMAASAMLSMWISNTATVLMMLPVATAVASHLPQGQAHPRFSAGLLLGVAYASSLGGLATPIGTPPNLIFLSQVEQWTSERAPGFLPWMTMALPLVAVCLLATWAWLRARFVSASASPSASAPAELRAPTLVAASKADLIEQLAALGPMSSAERRVAAVFALTALAWVFRADLELGPIALPGWQSALGYAPNALHDATVAVVAVLALFVLPAGSTTLHTAPSTRLLDWPTARSIPWGLLLLFGGGIALSAGFASSGASAQMGQALNLLADWPPWALVLTICLSVTFLTEVTSNTATASILMPVLGATAHQIGQPAMLLMLPAALCASCAFMLPVATAPNAIVFGTGKVTTREMASVGFALNLITSALITLWLLAAGFNLLD